MWNTVRKARLSFWIAGFLWALLPLTAQATTENPTTSFGPKVAPRLAARVASDAGPYPVVVLLWPQEVLNPDLSRSPFGKNISRYVSESQRLTDDVLAKLTAGDFEIRHRFGSFAGFSGRVTVEGIRRLEADPSVRLMLAEARATPHRAEGLALMRVPPVHAQGVTGEGVTVAVIDDGVDYTHPELGGGSFPNAVVIGGRDTGDDDDDPFPAAGDEGLDNHGTAVAGIIAGREGGVAPGANIVALKYTGAQVGDLSSILAAIDWAVVNKSSVDPAIGIINMSLGFDAFSGFFTSNCDSEPAAVPFTEAVGRANDAGIVVLASTGNENKKNATSVPSCLSNVVSVGAVYDADIGGADFGVCEDLETGADKVTCYSNSATFVHLLAPSHNCRTPLAGGGYHQDFGGTSAACPYAAGVTALLMSAVPGKTPEQYRDFLRLSGKPILDSGNGLAIPRVDAEMALAAAQGPGPDPPSECTPDDTTLCLHENRFQVRVTWRDFQDNTGPGRVVSARTEDSGLFYFFGPNNWEMLIKVLNGCTLNNHFWVFFAATTNVEFTVTVTDTAKGLPLQFRNSLGHSADAVTDTGAFATCP